MKVLKWFKTGERVPMDASYIKTESRATEQSWNEEGTCFCVSKDFHLYEVKEPKESP